MRICVQRHDTALVDNAFEHIVMFLVVPRYEKSSFCVVLVQNFKYFVRVCGRTVVSCKIVVFAVLVPVFLDSDLADRGALIS